MVMAAASLRGSIEERMKRTEPSAIATCIPRSCPPNGRPSPCHGTSAGSNPRKVDVPAMYNVERFRPRYDGKLGDPMLLVGLD